MVDAIFKERKSTEYLYCTLVATYDKIDTLIPTIPILLFIFD